ncbi:MAG: ROK family protein [Eubacteriales bacterium]|nr:ROK family protein [Eubacteriales bacterium]
MAEAYNNISKVRLKNEKLIKATLRSLGSATKAQVAHETEISVVTCGKILEDLLANKEVVEVAVEHASLGRPAKLYSYNAHFAYIAALYVEIDHNIISMETVVSDLNGTIIERNVRDNYSSMEYTDICNAISDLIASNSKIRTISVGIPGYICNGIVSLCNFTELMGLPLQRNLQREFPEMYILVENDMNACSYGFYRSEFPTTSSTVAMIYSPATSENKAESILRSAGIGYGAGFIADGHIIRGFSGFSGEVSFLPGVSNPESDLYEHRVETIAHIVNCIIPILNPEAVGVTGGRFDDIDPEDVRNACLQHIAPQHIPKFFVRPNFHEDYLNGLIQLALDHLFGQE